MRSATGRRALIGLAVGVLALLPVSESHSQGRAPAQTWWVPKSKGGIYKPPNKPIWRLADLLKAHAGQNNWSEQIVRDPEQDATYNSAAPGTKVGPHMHPDTSTLFVVIAGQMHFDVEGQQPVTATRGALVNIMHTTLFSYEVTGDRKALWVEVNPPNSDGLSFVGAAAQGGVRIRCCESLVQSQAGAVYWPQQADDQYL